jgi:hypothetical protein
VAVNADDAGRGPAADASERGVPWGVPAGAPWGPPPGPPEAFRRAPLAEQLAAVRAAWEEALERRAPTHGPFAAALDALATAARAEGVSVVELLKAGYTLAGSPVDIGRRAWDAARPEIGTRLVRAYYAEAPPAPAPGAGP